MADVSLAGIPPAEIEESSWVVMVSRTGRCCSGGGGDGAASVEPSAKSSVCISWSSVGGAVVWIMEGGWVRPAAGVGGGASGASGTKNVLPRGGESCRTSFMGTELDAVGAVSCICSA